MGYSRVNSKVRIRKCIPFYTFTSMFIKIHCGLQRTDTEDPRLCVIDILLSCLKNLEIRIKYSNVCIIILSYNYWSYNFQIKIQHKIYLLKLCIYSAIFGKMNIQHLSYWRWRSLTIKHFFSWNLTYSFNKTSLATDSVVSIKSFLVSVGT